MASMGGPERIGDRPAVAPEVRELVSALSELISMIEPQLIRLWRSNMTLSQRRLLSRLRRGSRTAGQLSAGLGISPPSLTRMLGRLEERGFVTRAMDMEDRRRIRVELTDAGREALANHPVFAGTPLGLAAHDLPPAELARLVAALRSYGQAARRHAETE